MCGIIKPESEFQKNKREKDGLQRYCRKCRAILSKVEYQRSKERYKKQGKKFRKKNPHYTRDYYRKNKLKLIQFMGNKCSICGLTLNDVQGCLGVFEIDEIKPLGIGKKKFSSLNKSRLMKAKQLFLDGKIQLLCANCSRIKSWKSGDYTTNFMEEKPQDL